MQFRRVSPTILLQKIPQGLLALLLILMTVFTWVLTSTNIEHSVSSIALKFRAELLSRTGDRVNSVLQGSNASATSLARLLGRIIDKGNISSLSFIQNQVKLAHGAFSLGCRVVMCSDLRVLIWHLNKSLYLPEILCLHIVTL